MKPEELLMPLFTVPLQPVWGYYISCGRNRKSMKNNDRIYSMSFAKYIHVCPAEKKGRTKEVDEIIRWLTGCNQEELETSLKSRWICDFL